MALKPVICISGFAAVGKSTAGKMLARRLGLKYFSGGDALKALAREMGYRPIGAGWWETPKGLEFLRLRSRDPSFDKKVDRKLLEVCRRGGVVVDSWVIPWLFKGRSLNIWITADKKVRARRMALRSKIPVSKALRILNRRDRESAAIYRRIYGIRIGEDFTPFHLVVDTTRMTPEQVVDVMAGVASHFFKRSPTRRRRR